MKKLLFLSALVIFSLSAKSQDFVFSAEQAGNAYRNNKTGKYGQAELSEADITITIKNKLLEVIDSVPAIYRLKSGEPVKKETRLTIKQEWEGTDKKNNRVLLRFVLDKQSKEAMIEVVNNKCKSYYFGKCTSVK